MEANDIRNFIIKWNRKFPVDRWWRDKHNVPFLSEQHRECSFLAQLMEFQEHLYFKEKSVVKEPESTYIPGAHDIFKPRLVVDKEGNPTIDKRSVEEFRKEMEEMRKKNG